jgi:hypothetical protein
MLAINMLIELVLSTKGFRLEFITLIFSLSQSRLHQSQATFSIGCRKTKCFVVYNLVVHFKRLTTCRA